MTQKLELQQQAYEVGRELRHLMDDPHPNDIWWSAAVAYNEQLLLELAEQIIALQEKKEGRG